MLLPSLPELFGHGWPVQRAKLICAAFQRVETPARTAHPAIRKNLNTCLAHSIGETHRPCHHGTKELCPLPKRKGDLKVSENQVTAIQGLLLQGLRDGIEPEVHNTITEAQLSSPETVLLIGASGIWHSSDQT